MNTHSASIPSRVLSSQGWDACLDSKLLRANQRWQQEPEFRAHGHMLRRLFNDIHADAVLCVEGRPTVCFITLSQGSVIDIEKIRRKLWNLGSTTLLLVEDRHEVRAYSTFAKPIAQVGEEHAQLSAETIRTLESIELALRIRQLVRRIETGAIYREHTGLFDPRVTVDRELLESLKITRDLICRTRTREDYQRAHTLLGRFLFSCYLLDRGIIGQAFLAKHGLPNAHDMLSLLRDSQSKAASLAALFSALHHDFNGSLFGEDFFEEASLEDGEVAHLERLLSGEDEHGGQLSLFKLYDFGLIPVELISSIYETFLAAEANAELTVTKRGARRESGQRRHGSYYTPLRLAELAVDVATEGWDSLLDKRCLDPACGSGIFLVVLFVRMSEEWRLRNPNADSITRYRSLLSILETNICGVDIQQTACLVTCFSLYLAFLDQMDPKEIEELGAVLKRERPKARLLPRIFRQHNNATPRSGDFGTIQESDFFRFPHNRDFDLVIGNPPWVSRKPSPSAEKWILSASNPYGNGMGSVADRERRFFPARELACAFSWKSGLHLTTTGRVCQILPSRLFLSNNTDEFQAAWLSSHRLEAVWLLADYRFILFPNADCPCMVVRYHPGAQDGRQSAFDFISPKVERLDPRHALIPVMPEDQKLVDQAGIIAAAERNEAAAAWKIYHWGTPRDHRLIERLSRLPRLSRITSSPPRSGASVKRKRRVWYKGQGFQPASASTEVAKPIFWRETDFFLSADAPVSDFVLSKSDVVPIGDKYREQGLHRPRNPLVYEAPLLLINKAVTKFLFSDFNVLFQDDFQSICAPPKEEEELLFLTAVFSSDLAQYFLFHTTANIGIERDIARLEEMMELPFPLPEDMESPERAKDIIRQCATIIGQLRANRRSLPGLEADSDSSAIRQQLNALVEEYYSLSQWEKQLVRDTIEMFRPSSMPASFSSPHLLTVQHSSREEREAYAQTLVATFRAWSRTEKKLSAHTCTARHAGLAVTTLGVGSTASYYDESELEEYVENLIKSIDRGRRGDDGAAFCCLRGFAFYEANKVHILKPLARRHWTCTAAQNDADEILIHMLEEGGWGA